MTTNNLKIIDIWQTLNGGPIRHGRGKAFWRRGDGWSVALYPKTNSWYDFVSGCGGGPLQLVETALRTNRDGARRWLHDVFGVPLAERPVWTPEQRRAFGRRMGDARDTQLAAIEELEQALARAKSAAWALIEIAAPDPAIDAAGEIVRDLTRRRDVLQSASPADLARVLDARRSRALLTEGRRLRSARELLTADVIRALAGPDRRAA